jgi:predicted phosphodiesterase
MAKRICKIQYVSDLHLEFYDTIELANFVKPVAKYLALAGDIGKPGHALYDRFLQYASDNWKHVFYVAGNHEYYDTCRNKWKYKAPTTFEERHSELIRTTNKYSNIHFLRRDSPSYYLAEENIAVVGSTLWTHISDTNVATALHGMSDYNYIARYEDGEILPIRPAFLNKIHEEEKQMLDLQIHYWETQKTDVVAVTHHMPSFSLIGSRYANDPLNFCFASHCESLIRPPVKAWIYGHTHNPSSGMFGHTYMACNPRGYPKEHVHGFQTDRCLEFRPTNNEYDALNPELAAAALGIQNPEITQLNAEEIVWV